MTEAAALSLFVPVSSTGNELPAVSIHRESASLHQILVDSGVLVPTLLHHDPANHVLILSDLGPLPDLSQVFTDLGGFTPGSSSAGSEPPEYAPRLGCPLGASEIK